MSPTQVRWIRLASGEQLLALSVLGDHKLKIAIDQELSRRTHNHDNPWDSLTNQRSYGIFRDQQVGDRQIDKLQQSQIETTNGNSRQQTTSRILKTANQ